MFSSITTSPQQILLLFVKPAFCGERLVRTVFSASVNNNFKWRNNFLSLATPTFLYLGNAVTSLIQSWTESIHIFVNCFLFKNHQKNWKKIYCPSANFHYFRSICLMHLHSLRWISVVKMFKNFKGWSGEDSLSIQHAVYRTSTKTKNNHTTQVYRRGTLSHCPNGSFWV